MTKQDEYRYDLFISYSHDDREWVLEWLLPLLKESGLRVCIDDPDFVVGLPSLLNMERAIDSSRHTLLVLTPAWVQSEWTEFEVLLAHTSDPAGRKRRLLPILLKSCETPRRISMLTYADFTQQEKWDTQLQRLVAAVRGEPNLPPDVGPPLSPLRPDDPLSSLKERFAELAKREQIPIACIGGIYLDIEIHGIEVDKENGRHCLDFTREVPVTVHARPGGSVYYVARYLSALGWNPLIVSSVGDGSINGLADTFFQLAARDGLQIDKRMVTRKLGAATAITVHFVHPDPERASSAMYTDRDVLKSFGWRQVSETLRGRGKDEQVYDNGAIYIAGFFKTSLYRDLHKNLSELQQNGAVIFLDHGRLEPEQGRDQVRNLTEALRLVDVYFSTKEELSQFIAEIARTMPQRVKRPIHSKDPLPDLIKQIDQEARICFPPIILVKDRTGIPRAHMVGVRDTDGEYQWKDIQVERRASYPISQCIVGASNAFNAAFIDAFLRFSGEINIEAIVRCAEEAQLRLISVEAGGRIEELPTSMKGRSHA
jgi:sugar/nucleoside kinase (ribokinase family)